MTTQPLYLWQIYILQEIWLDHLVTTRWILFLSWLSPISQRSPSCPVCRWLPWAGALISDPGSCPINIGSCDTKPGDLSRRNHFWPLCSEGIWMWQARVSQVLSGSKGWQLNKVKLHIKFSRMWQSECTSGCKTPSVQEMWHFLQLNVVTLLSFVMPKMGRMRSKFT